MKDPLVSIIIPTFNRPFILKETLDSVIRQHYKNWECLVIDDGSDEEIRKHVENICSKDSRIIFHSRPINYRKGASACRNYGLAEAKGELIQFLDDDDLLDKEKLAEQIKLYSGSNQDSLFTCQWGGFTDAKDLKSRFKYQYHSYRNFKRGANLLNSFGLYNEYFPVHVYITPRSLIEKAGPWNEELNNNDDAEFFTRVILVAGKIVFTPGAKVFYRYNGAQKLSELDSSEKIKSAIKSWKLIEGEINNGNNRGAEKYVKRAKNNLYNYFQLKDQKVLKDNQEFFKDRKSYSGIYYRLGVTIKEHLKK